jgi:putative transposase
MTRLDITKATRLLYRRLNLRMVARRADAIDWTCDRTGSSFTFTDTEIAQLIGDDQAEFQGLGGSFEPEPTPDPEDIREADMAAAFRRFEYVEAVRAAALPKRAKIDLFEEVIAAVAARLEDHRVPSSRSVKRWDAKAGDPPNPYRLIDDHSAKGNRTDRITDAQRELIDRMIDHYHLRPTRPSVDSLVAMVRDEVNVCNVALTDDLKMAIPGRRAIESVLHERNPQAVDAARYGQAWAHQKHGAVDRQADPEAPLDRVELDHTRADIFLVSEDDHLPIGRPTIGFAIDRCTRMPLGLYVGFEEPSVLTVMQILKHTILPKTYVAQMVESGEWDLRHRWDAWGTPRTIVLDRARENMGRDLRPSLRELGVRDVIFAAAKQGRQKGAVERHFRTLNRKLLHEQKGTTFSNIGDRGDYDPRKHAVLTLPEFQRQLHRYFVDIYPHSKHAGLRNDIPARVWKEKIHLHPSAPPRPLSEIVHLFTRTERRVVHRDGILLFNMEYVSPELDQVRRSPDFHQSIRSAKQNGGDGKVLVRYDPADISQLWIQLPQSKRYMKVPVSPRWVDYASGKSVWEHAQVMAHHRITTDAAFDPDALAGSRRKLVDETDAAGARLIARRRLRARLDGYGRTSPAGDDASTSPLHSEASKRKRRRQPSPINDNVSRPRPESTTRSTPARVAAAPAGFTSISFDEE